MSLGRDKRPKVKAVRQHCRPYELLKRGAPSQGYLGVAWGMLWGIDEAKNSTNMGLFEGY